MIRVIFCFNFLRRRFELFRHFSGASKNSENVLKEDNGKGEFLQYLVYFFATILVLFDTYL